MNRIDKSAIDNALSHIRQEIGFENIRISIESNYEMIQKAHDSIHESMYLASFCLPDQPGVSWHSRSAFLCYHWEAFHQAHRSLLDALSGYYNSAYVLLRNTVELLLRGAFWECLAHKEFREKAAILEKHKGKRRSLKDWIDSLIEQKPSIEKYLEETSAAIFDRIRIKMINISRETQCQLTTDGVMVGEVLDNYEPKTILFTSFVFLLNSSVLSVHLSEEVLYVSSQ